jgi:hypothetical protein
MAADAPVRDLGLAQLGGPDLQPAEVLNAGLIADALQGWLDLLEGRHDHVAFIWGDPVGASGHHGHHAMQLLHAVEQRNGVEPAGGQRPCSLEGLHLTETGGLRVGEPRTVSWLLPLEEAAGKAEDGSWPMWGFIDSSRPGPSICCR